MNIKTKNKFISYFIGSLQAFIGLTAVAGGFRLVSNPNGIPDFPIEWLSNSPFTSYLIPGLVLLIVIGFGNILGGTITFLRKKYSGNIAVLLGVFLIFYMTIEVWFVGLRNFLQPLYFILGVIVLIFGFKLSKLAITFYQLEVGSTPNKLSA